MQFYVNRFFEIFEGLECYGNFDTGLYYNWIAMFASSLSLFHYEVSLNPGRVSVMMGG